MLTANSKLVYFWPRMRALISILSLLFILVGKTSYAGVTVSFDRAQTTVTLAKEQGPAWHKAAERPVVLDDADLDTGEETAFDHEHDGSDGFTTTLHHLRDDWLQNCVPLSSVLFVPSPEAELSPVANSLPIYLQNRVLRI